MSKTSRSAGDWLDGLALYRNSDPQQETSIADQKTWVQATCPGERIRIVAEFEDADISGSELDKRQGLQDAMAYVERRAKERRPVQVLVCWDGERFSRSDSIRTNSYLARFLDAGVTRMFSSEGWIDFNSEIDRVLYNLKQDLTRQAYPKAVSRNVILRAYQRALQGWWVAGPPPYGYTVSYLHWTDKRGRKRRTPQALLLGDPVEVEAVKWIFQEYAWTSATFASLLRTLTERGVPAPRGAQRWADWHLHKLFRNEAYLGRLVWNGKTQAKYFAIENGQPTKVNGDGRSHQRPVDRQHAVIVEAAHPALTDEATWRRCQEKLAANYQRRTTPIERGGAWVLSGLVCCGSCGRPLTGGRRETHGYAPRYRCLANKRYGPGSCRGSATVLQTDLLGEVGQRLRESFSPRGRARLLATIERLARQGDQDRRQARDALARRLESLRARIKQGYANLAVLPPDMHTGVTAVIREAEAEVIALDQRREELETVQAVSEEKLAHLRTSFAELSAWRRLSGRGRPSGCGTCWSAGSSG